MTDRRYPPDPTHRRPDPLRQRRLDDLEREVFERLGRALHERYRLGHGPGVPPGIVLDVPAAVDFEAGARVVEDAAAWLLVGLFQVPPDALRLLRRPQVRVVGVYLHPAPSAPVGDPPADAGLPSAPPGG